MSQPLPSNENKSTMRLMLEEKDFIFDKTYKRLQKINEGAFGEVFRGVNIHNHELVAIKFEKPNTKFPNTLEREAKFLKHLKEIKGIPRIFCCGKQHNVKVIVMELLGNSLTEKLAYSTKLSLKSILIIADQILEILKNIHAKGVLHRDIKPENILFGINQESKDIYLTDFGISKLYLDQNNCHIPFETDCAFVGTIRFASEAAHKGHQLSRKDDLESLGYILIYLVKGTLPWLNLKNLDVYQRRNMVGEMKSSFYLDELCSNLPSVFSVYLKYVKRLGFYENPDYTYMKNLFSSLLNSLDVKIEDHNWEWSKNYHSMKTTETTKKNTSSPYSVDKSYMFLHDSNNTNRDQKVEKNNDKSQDDIDEANKSQRMKKKSFTLNVNSIKGLSNIKKDGGKKIEDEVKQIEFPKKSRKSLGFGCESVFLDFHKILQQKVDKDDNNQINEEDHENDDDKYEEFSAFYKQEMASNYKTLMSLGNRSIKSNKSFTNVTNNSIKAKSRFAESAKDHSLNSNANISFENDKKSDISQNDSLDEFKTSNPLCKIVVLLKRNAVKREEKNPLGRGILFLNF